LIEDDLDDIVSFLKLQSAETGKTAFYSMTIPESTSASQTQFLAQLSHSDPAISSSADTSKSTLG
jgi:hypothetical protein